MADIYDQASEREELDRQIALEKQSKAKAARPDAQGYCLHCFEDFAPEETERLFCNDRCSAAYKPS